MTPRDPHREDAPADALDALLRESPHIDDAGFSEHVMRRLPRAAGRFRGWAVSFAGAAGLAAAGSSPRAAERLSDAGQLLLADGMFSIAGALTLVAVVLAAVWAAVEA